MRPRPVRDRAEPLRREATTPRPRLPGRRPTQRHVVLDARHVGVEDLPESNLVTAVVRLEQTRTPWDLVEVARRLRRWLRRPDDDGLRRVLGRWVREVAESFVPPGEALGAELTLEEVEMTVVERAREWSRQLIREGREQGIEQGRVQGLAHERALLRRMAALRFGAATAERLEEALAGVADPGVWSRSASGWCAARPGTSFSPAPPRRGPSPARASTERRRDRRFEETPEPSALAPSQSCQRCPSSGVRSPSRGR